MKLPIDLGTLIAQFFTPLASSSENFIDEPRHVSPFVNLIIPPNEVTSISLASSALACMISKLI